MKDNQTPLIIGGIAILGLGAMYFMNQKGKTQQVMPQYPAQPVQYIQAPQPAYQQPTYQQPAPTSTPTTKPSVVQKASGILDVAKKGFSFVKGLFSKKSVNGLGSADQGYYFDQQYNTIVITDEELYNEVQRQLAMEGQPQPVSGLPGMM